MVYTNNQRWLKAFNSCLSLTFNFFKLLSHLVSFAAEGGEVEEEKEEEDEPMEEGQSQRDFTKWDPPIAVHWQSTPT